MTPLQISEPAAVELAEAVRWYEERRPGWGARLFDAVSHAFELIERHPEMVLQDEFDRLHGSSKSMDFRTLSSIASVPTMCTLSRLPIRADAQDIGRLDPEGDSLDPHATVIKGEMSVTEAWRRRSVAIEPFVQVGQRAGTGGRLVRAPR